MSGAVYQPTTVTYESNGERWQDRPISYLASTVTEVASTPCGISCVACRGLCPVLLLTTCVTCLIVGIILLIQGALGYAGTSQSEENVYLLLTIFGALFFSVSCLLFVIFLRMTRRWCWSTGKDHLDIVGSPGLTINPSTDLLVTAQYAPVSEVAYQPTQQEDSEQSKLMPQENKDLKEDTDCMIERDPRIVLRPLNQPIHEET
ncbi:uncharacterized protein LOC123317453 isoform X1 [Coccinella septempunctata]|uniref:uncharacterized protein LOC123317453 isoform X1 n=1 Tax=Coccinella septempunctata TaxID=41139 RepID=UPI001D071D82|nr:uncharacterized protein LOC123317453 isoform X1 [Coccinella septempunctata]